MTEYPKPTVRELHLVHDPEQRTVSIDATLEPGGRYTATGGYDEGHGPELTLDLRMDNIETHLDPHWRTYEAGDRHIRVTLDCAAKIIEMAKVADQTGDRT